MNRETKRQKRTFVRGGGERAEIYDWLQKTIHMPFGTEMDWILILECILLLVICLLHSFPEGHYANFYAINGTFQNFNPIRRLLDGQIPYKDFADYLGLGHLYVGALLTFLFGGNYQSSLMAFSFLSFVCLAMLALVIGKSVLNSWKIAVGLTNILLIILLLQRTPPTNEMAFSLCSALGTGNSARFVRGLVLPLTIAMFRLGVHIYGRKRAVIEKYKIGKCLPAIGAGCLAGASFAWSNDYGASCFVCIAIMTGVISFARKRKVVLALIDMLAEMAASGLSLILTVEILTLGHWRQWFKSALGTGSYQSWYYSASRSYYLYNVDFSYIMMIQALMTIAYIIFLFNARGSKAAIFRYGIPAFANMACFCAVNEYQLLSGGSNREVALSVLFLSIAYEVANIMSTRRENAAMRKGILLTSLIVSLAWTISTTKDEMVFQISGPKEGKYISCMGGNMTALYEDLETTHDFLKGEKFFSTYASAQELMEDTFQPSGTDYIIHVLGDEQREDYLTDFINGDFTYAATIRKEYTEWEYWVERANWFFYRELYRNWHPVFSNSYEMYWERNKNCDENTWSSDYDVQIEAIGDGAARLILQADKSVNGIADVYIDYSVDKDPESELAEFQFRQELVVSDASDLRASNSLRRESAEYIPMTIVNGYGELILQAYPQGGTTLNLREVRCNDIFRIGYQLSPLTDGNWTSGYSNFANILLFEYDENLLANLFGSTFILCEGESFPIENIDYDDLWIRVSVGADATICKYPRYIQLG